MKEKVQRIAERVAGFATPAMVGLWLMVNTVGDSDVMIAITIGYVTLLPIFVRKAEVKWSALAIIAQTIAVWYRVLTGDIAGSVELLKWLMSGTFLIAFLGEHWMYVYEGFRATVFLRHLEGGADEDWPAPKWFRWIDMRYRCKRARQRYLEIATDITPRRWSPESTVLFLGIHYSLFGGVYRVYENDNGRTNVAVEGARIQVTINIPADRADTAHRALDLFETKGKDDLNGTFRKAEELLTSQATNGSVLIA